MHLTSLFLVILVTQIFFWNILCLHNKNIALDLFMQEFKSILLTCPPQKSVDFWSVRLATQTRQYVWSTFRTVTCNTVVVKFEKRCSPLNCQVQISTQHWTLVPIAFASRLCLAHAFWFEVVACRVCVWAGLAAASTVSWCWILAGHSVVKKSKRGPWLVGDSECTLGHISAGCVCVTKPLSSVEPQFYHL